MFDVPALRRTGLELQWCNFHMPPMWKYLNRTGAQAEGINTPEGPLVVAGWLGNDMFPVLHHERRDILDGLTALLFTKIHYATRAITGYARFAKAASQRECVERNAVKAGGLGNG